MKPPSPLQPTSYFFFAINRSCTSLLTYLPSYLSLFTTDQRRAGTVDSSERGRRKELQRNKRSFQDSDRKFWLTGPPGQPSASRRCRRQSASQSALGKKFCKDGNFRLVFLLGTFIYRTNRTEGGKKLFSPPTEEENYAFNSSPLTHSLTHNLGGTFVSR